MRPGIVHGADWGIAKNRVDKAIEEYERGMIDFLIMAGRNESEVMAEYAVKMGVPSSSIAIEDKSKSTIENLYFSEKFLRKIRGKKVKCITSWWHVPRVRYDAKIILRGYEVSVVGSIDKRIKNEIEKDVRLERIKMIRDKTILELLHYLYWPDKLKITFEDMWKLLKPYSLFLNNNVYESMSQNSHKKKTNVVF